VPVATTVHDLQVVDSMPRDPTDQPLSVIATPTHAIRIKRPSAASIGIDWTRLGVEDLQEMPILAENDNIERRKRLITLMEDLDFVTRLERSGQTADAAEPLRDR
jgi:hypothetical protein